MLQFLKKSLSKLFISVCRPFNSRDVTVVPSSQDQKQEYYKYEQITPSGMSLFTENFLRGNLIRHGLDKSPQKVLTVVNDFYEISNDPVYLLIAADICRYFAGKGAEKEKIGFHLAAFRYSILSFAAKKGSAVKSCEYNRNFTLLQEIQIANEAIAGIFTYLKKNRLLDSSNFSLHGPQGIEFVFEKPTFLLSVPREMVTDLSLCSGYCVKSLRLINRHPGLGVPLVAKISSRKQESALRTPVGLTIPVTLFFRQKIHSPQKISLFPYYQDTSIREDFFVKEESLGQGNWTLARDFSTPLACFMNDVMQRNLLSTMLNPVKYDKNTGLFMVEPYAPGKIPVVFIHGLMSSPETWGQMINSLKYDQRIRQKYQFWFFSYSTGVPVFYAASKLHEALQRVRDERCTTPEAMENFEKMVLVGHSMGGLITRLLLQKNPARMVETLCGSPWSEFQKQILPEEVRLIREMLILEPLPFIKRAVFMAVPHRGSAVAQKQIAKLGIRLIRLPRELLNKKDKIKRIWKILMPNEKMCWRKDSFITGIDNLNPKSIFVRWMADAPLRDDVTYHSIIGNRKEAAMPGGSDGIVPYTSSHLDGVASECIVKSDHSVHRTPSAIKELLRILVLHLQENEKAAPSLPAGEKNGPPNWE